MTLQACVTLPSCLASSNSPTFALITLRSVIVMTVTPVVRPWRCAPHWLRAPASGPTDSIRPSDRVKTSTLYEAANVILTRPVKESLLKSWAMRLAIRAGMRKAKVALARKLAVVLHRMLADETETSLQANPCQLDAELLKPANHCLRLAGNLRL